MKRKNWRKENERLVEQFPFLRIGHDTVITELDFMAEGWRKAFAEKMCQEIKDNLLEADCLDKFTVYDIKEKYGELRWYDNAYEVIHSPEHLEKHNAILEKYTELSKVTCIQCGAPALKRYSQGAPYCPTCWRR